MAIVKRDIRVRGLLVGLLLSMFAATSAPAQSFRVIHSFTAGADGYYPTGAGLSIDSAGNLYGGAAYGGFDGPTCLYYGTHTGCGVIFKMIRRGSDWLFNPLVAFDGADGYNPAQRIAIASDGTLFGSTIYGGPGDCFGGGCGTVFRLQPTATFCHSVLCPWHLSELHQFQGEPNDGAYPELGSLTFDAAGNVYGTTEVGGLYGFGTVYKLTRNGNSWDISIIYNFSGYNDGANPRSGLVFDSAGNMYGTTIDGGEFGFGGVVYKLTPTQSGWTQTVIHSFNYRTDGAEPTGNLVMDGSGNFYGITSAYGPQKNGNGGGTVWELSPSDGGWNFAVLYAFNGAPYYGPSGGLLRDSAGNLYGAAQDSDHGWGAVFELTPSNGGWNYTSLHTFTGGSDGGVPSSQLVMDSAGNLFGTAVVGGSSPNCPSGCGVVFEITP